MSLYDCDLISASARALCHLPKSGRWVKGVSLEKMMQQSKRYEWF